MTARTVSVVVHGGPSVSGSAQRPRLKVLAIVSVVGSQRLQILSIS